MKLLTSRNTLKGPVTRETRESEMNNLNDLGMRVRGKHIYTQKLLQPTTSWRDISRVKQSTDVDPTTADNIDSTTLQH